LELDDTLADAHRTLGAILQRYYWRWDEGDKEFRRAQELGGKRALGPANSLDRVRGTAEDRIAKAERARDLDPLSASKQIDLAVAYRAAHQYDRAVVELRRALEIAARAGSQVHVQLGITYLQMGRSKEANAEFETTVKLAPTPNPRFEAYLGYAYAVSGRQADARSVLKALESRSQYQYVSSFGMALIDDALGDKEAAVAALERAYQDRAVEFSLMTDYPAFKTIAADSRYVAVMRQVGFPGLAPQWTMMASGRAR